MDDRERMYFHKLPRALRERLAKALDMPELIPVDGRTARRAQKRYRVELRGQWAKDCTVEEAAKEVNKTSHSLQVAVSMGRGIASFRSGDDIYTVERVKPEPLPH
jgi:hypothetical protein